MLFFQLETPLCLHVPLLFFFFLPTYTSQSPGTVSYTEAFLHCVSALSCPAQGGDLANTIMCCPIPFSEGLTPVAGSACGQSSAFCYHGGMASGEESCPA
ncbi:unnamed protein product [Rangifer tarandus platyrhynchus]|uniref:Uncharacterized protein n=1 Tax=Rangifer tarandus platyrhynchus TaxID=3082113 RepID=A0ABN8ZZ22_RANTA|nr:unnamed protein product [Rangifer tarandus platyrhynchus]